MNDYPHWSRNSLVLATTLIVCSSPAKAAEITWAPPEMITASSDILNPEGGVLHVAADFNTDGGTSLGDDNMINGIEFTQTPATGSERLESTMNSGPAKSTGLFFTGVTDDEDLTSMLDSHSWLGGNPATAGYVLNNLSPGHLYQVQLIPVADARACCAARTYEPDDGQGNFTTGVSVARGDFASIVGTFVADAGTQAIGWRSLGEIDGNNDPGLSGIVVFRVVSPNDSDSDGLSDEWESFYDLDPDASDSDGDGTPDGAEDADMDGLVNSAEQAAGTSPVDGDSDDDGFTDGVENNSGEWDSATATGTDPMDADTDNDRLLDGVENPDLPFLDENQTGSDPNLADTDGDQFDDGLEVAEGSDPTDINDRPAVPVITLIDGLLGGDLTDPEDDGVEEATLPGPPQTAGLNFDWVSITASSEEYFSGFGAATEGAFDLFDNKVGAGETKWCCGGPPQNATVEFENPVSISHFTISSGNDTPDRDPRDWQILGSNDGIDFTPIFTRADDEVIWTARNQTALVTLASPSAAYRFIRYEVTRTVAGHQINEIEYFGTVGGTPLQITGLVYDEATEMITLTWTSKPGRSYGVFYDTDLDGFQNDVDDGVPADAVEETTSFTFPNPLDGEPRVYFRVQENPL